MMTRKKILRGISLAALAMQWCLHSSFAGGPGTGAFQFLQLGVGARPAAMGEVFTGVADDVNAIYWNPAGLAGLERREATLSHALWLEGITYSNAACALPVQGGAVGVAFNVLNSGDIPKADNEGERLSDNYNMLDAMGIISYARGWGELALGVNLKFISSRIEEEYAHSYAMDAGALYSGFRPWGRRLRLGLAVQNAGTKAKYVSEENSLPVIIRAGGALQLFKSLLVASELNYTDKNINSRYGVEYTRAFGAFAVAARAGYKYDTVKELGALSGLTAGMGVKWSDYQLDYAWNSFTDLGVTHRISMGIKFGVPGVKKEQPAAAPVLKAVSAPDTDGDGVTDSLDKCSGTSAGTVVDATGCVPGVL